MGSGETAPLKSLTRTSARTCLNKLQSASQCIMCGELVAQSNIRDSSCRCVRQQYCWQAARNLASMHPDTYHCLIFDISVKSRWFNLRSDVTGTQVWPVLCIICISECLADVAALATGVCSHNVCPAEICASSLK